jgi:hypothetical protein
MDTNPGLLEVISGNTDIDEEIARTDRSFKKRFPQFVRRDMVVCQSRIPIRMVEFAARA